MYIVYIHYRRYKLNLNVLRAYKRVGQKMLTPLFTAIYQTLLHPYNYIYCIRTYRVSQIFLIYFKNRLKVIFENLF